jgi:hypothetical protein
MLSGVWGARILGLFSVFVLFHQSTRLMGADLRCIRDEHSGGPYSRRTVPNEEIGAEEGIADILGWEQLEYIGNNQITGRDPLDGNRKTVPPWAFDLRAAYALENRLVSLGLGKNYIRALQALVSGSSSQSGGSDPNSVEVMLAVKRAAPAMRALAALNTLRDACRTVAPQQAR